MGLIVDVHRGSSNAEQTAEAREVFDAAEVPTEGRWAWINERKWKHRQKMERKELDRYERGSRRTMEYERWKAGARLRLHKLRTWLKSPHAFR